MNLGDPLATVELLVLIEESTGALRHDVRNRIASIRNLAFFVRRKLGTEEVPDRDPRVTEFLGKIEGEVQRTDELIDAWSARVQGVKPLAPQAVKLLESVRLAVEAVRLPAGITFELQVPESLEIETDRELLACAVRCLLENAGQAQGSGAVRVYAERVENDARLVVCDEGPGITDSARCLERFESTKPGHLGLGLCIARRIATRCAGQLVIGTPTSGAEVSLLLPIAGTRPAPEGEP